MVCFFGTGTPEKKNFEVGEILEVIRPRSFEGTKFCACQEGSEGPVMFIWNK